MRLLLVRHGESVANASGVYQGWYDSPLSALGERQALATARAIAARADLRPFAVYASPLARAWDTGAAIATAVGLTPLAHAGLREINVGAATGLHYTVARERWPELEEQRQALGLDHGWPEGETGREFGARVAAALEEIIARHLAEEEDGAQSAEAAVVLASHGGTIRFALAHLRGDSANVWPHDPVGNCSIAEVQITAAGRRVLTIDRGEHLIE